MTVSDLTLKAAKYEGKRNRIPIGDGVVLDVMATKKVWRLRYRNPDTKKPAFYTLGIYTRSSQPNHIVMKQTEARRAAFAVKDLLAQGIDPVEHEKRVQQEAEAQERERAAEAAKTFEAIARAWHEQRNLQGKWSEGHAAKIMTSLEMHVFPVIGSFHITEVTAPVLLDLLEPLQRSGRAETAKKVNQRINAILRYAVVRQMVQHNEADNLRDELATHKVRHNPYLEVGEIHDFLQALHGCGSSDVMKIAVEFTMHTLARTAETRFAKWSEFDLDSKLWNVPAERMKMKRAHVVPLSTQVLAMLEKLQPLTGHREYLFPTYNPRKPMSENAMLSVLYRMGYKSKLTVHGLRATGSTILNDSGFRSEVIEAALSHSIKDKVAAAYNHAQYLEERREMLQWYSDYLDSLRTGADVIPINRKRL